MHLSTHALLAFCSSPTLPQCQQLQGLRSCPAAGSWVERQRRLEASPCYNWSGIQVFLCASARNQGKEEARGPSSGRHSGEDAPGARGCHVVTMTTAAPRKPEVGGGCVCGKAPPPCRCCLGEKRPLGPPAHPPSFVTRSPSFPKQNNTPGTH